MEITPVVPRQAQRNNAIICIAHTVHASSHSVVSCLPKSRTLWRSREQRHSLPRAQQRHDTINLLHRARRAAAAGLQLRPQRAELVTNLLRGGVAEAGLANGRRGADGDHRARVSQQRVLGGDAHVAPHQLAVLEK